MTTATTQRPISRVSSSAPTQIRQNLRFEHVFFSGMAALILVSVVIGFTATFYLRDIVKMPVWADPRPLPFLVITHGTVFSLWILLLITQTSLVAAHRVRIHQRLGIAGFALASLLVLLGFVVLCVAMARHFPPASPALSTQAGAIFSVVGFALLVFFGYRLRRNPPAHKRLMILGTVSLLDAAFNRWPGLHHVDYNHLLSSACCFALLVLVACYDLWSRTKIQPATMWGGVTLIVTHAPIHGIFTHNAIWFHLAVHMQTLGHLFLRA
jgi:hypothetical protein